MDNLDSFVKNYNYRGSVMEYATDYCADIFLRRMKKGSVLELGPAEGIMTERLLPHFPDYTVVDGSEVFVNLLKEKFPKVNVVHSFFEDFKPESKFDNIVLGHVLEHVDDPVKILKLCSEWLSCVVDGCGGGGNYFVQFPTLTAFIVRLP